MPDSNSNDFLLSSNIPGNPNDRASQLKNSLCTTTSNVGLVVPSSNAEHRECLVSSLSRDSKIFSSSAGSSECGSSGGVAKRVEVTESSGIVNLNPELNYFSENNNCSENSQERKESGCFSKMFTCRVLVILLLVKCIILSFVIPAQLIPTSSFEAQAAQDYTDNAISGGDSHQSTGDEDGFDNNIMLDDQPLSLTFKTEIMNLVEPFDILSQPVTPPEPNGVNGDVDGNGVASNPEGNGDSTGNGPGNDDDDDDDTTTTAPEESQTGASESTGETGDSDGSPAENQVEDGGDGDTTDASDSDSGPAAADASTEKSNVCKGQGDFT